MGVTRTNALRQIKAILDMDIPVVVRVGRGQALPDKTGFTDEVERITLPAYQHPGGWYSVLYKEREYMVMGDGTIPSFIDLSWVLVKED